MDQEIVEIGVLMIVGETPSRCAVVGIYTQLAMVPQFYIIGCPLTISGHLSDLGDHNYNHAGCATTPQPLGAENITVRD